MRVAIGILLIAAFAAAAWWVQQHEGQPLTALSEGGAEMASAEAPPLPGAQISPALASRNPAVAVSAHDFLVAGETEAPGYGLYSYLLLPSGDPSLRARNLAALEALVVPLNGAADAFGAGNDPAEINLTYIPVTEVPGSGASIQWLLDHYDHAQAKRLLDYAGEAPATGPFLVSYAAPIDAPLPEGANVLIQDMSWVPPEKVSLWVQEFGREVRDPRRWNEDSIGRLLVNLRTAVAIIAEPLGFSVAAAAERYIVLKVID